MKNVDEYYEKWSGVHHTINACHPVHDSAETCDFAEQYFKERSEPLKQMLKKILSIENAAFGLKGFDAEKLKSEIIDAIDKTYDTYDLGRCIKVYRKSIMKKDLSFEERKEAIIKFRCGGSV